MSSCGLFVLKNNHRLAVQAIELVEHKASDA